MPAAARGLPAGIAAGGLAALALFVSGVSAWVTLSSVPMALMFFRRPVAWAVAAGFTCITASLHWQLQDRLPAELSGALLAVDGQISGLPEVHEKYTRFRFRVREGSARAAEPKPESPASGLRLPANLLVYWYRESPDLRPGEFWRLDVVVRPPWGKVNFNGPDRERWLFAEGIGALATVQSGEKLSARPSGPLNWNVWRQLLAGQIERVVPDQHLQGVIKALAVADRSDMPVEQRNVLARTGTAHLLAISGLHVGLAALFGFWLARIILLPLPLGWTAGSLYPLALLTGWLAALCYAALAGFATSTVRALVMLGVGLLVLLLRRSTQPAQALLSALVLLLVLDPASALGAGFWLSFAAVAILLFLFSGCGESNRKWWLKLPRAQAGIMLALLPLTAFWFGSASVAGLLANLLAIPWVSTVTVPLVLLAMLLAPISQAFSAVLFNTAAQSAGWLLDLLSLMALWPAASLNLTRPALWLALLAGLGALLLLLPRGLPHRYLGLALMLPLFAQARPPAPGALRLDVLDVGQGTSVLLNTPSRLMLYDTGPGDGGSINVVSQVIEPAVQNSGHAAPHQIIVSHGDLDHAGGLAALQALYPDATINASLPRPMERVGGCDQRLSWNWEELHIEVLHPGPYLPYMGNDSSCVLSIRSPSASILLPGDISSTVEQRLMITGLRPHDVLLVPHHGSKSSSSAGFIDMLAPEAAVATAGNGNRFDFPRHEVKSRLRTSGVPLWSTNACGAVRINFSETGQFRALSARRVRAAPWRWPAGENCP